MLPKTIKVKTIILFENGRQPQFFLKEDKLNFSKRKTNYIK
jgi:hypothetical protein